MYRDYTCIDDIVGGIISLINKAPNIRQIGKFKNDSLSHVAPFRILNIGNTKKIYLLDFINTLLFQNGQKIDKTSSVFYSYIEKSLKYFMDIFSINSKEK